MDQEVKQAVRKIQDKYARLGWKKKGKEKAGPTAKATEADTLPSQVETEMNISG